MLNTMSNFTFVGNVNWRVFTQLMFKILSLSNSHMRDLYRNLLFILFFYLGTVYTLTLSSYKDYQATRWQVSEVLGVVVNEMVLNT